MSGLYRGVGGGWQGGHPNLSTFQFLNDPRCKVRDVFVATASEISKDIQVVLHLLSENLRPFLLTSTSRFIRTDCQTHQYVEDFDLKNWFSS